MEFRRKIPPTAEAAEQLCRELRPQLAALAGKRSFAAELLFREALANAVAHGSAEGSTEARVVRCIVRRRRGWLTLAVQDEGPGFDWRSKLGREADPEAECGRGLALYRAYADRFRFNKAGNSVILQLHLKDEPA